VIRRIRLSDFKSIGASTSVDLSQLTVLTGPNSSGKSTLLQSLLLLAQTVLHAGTDRQLVLNGPLTRLGDFQQVLHSGSTSRIFTIGLEIAPFTENLSAETRQRRIIKQADRPSLVSLDCGFTDKALHPDSIVETSTFPLVSRFAMQAFFDVGEDAVQEYDLSVRRHPWRPERRAIREGLDDLPDVYFDGLAWHVEVDAISGNELKDNEDGWPLKGALFDHFLPRTLLAKSDLNRDLATIVLDYLMAGRTQSPQVTQNFPLTGVLWDDISTLMPDYSGPTVQDKVTPELVNEWLSGQSPAYRRRFRAALRDNRDRFADRFARTMDPSYWLNNANVPSRLNLGIRTIQKEISELRYLGPLRVQPSPIYPVANTLGSQDVGPSGEWTASVLDEYKDARIRYVSPDELPLETDKPSETHGSLITAVNEWMDYLGVSGDVQTVDRGSLGHELKVTTSEGSRLMPLTHVGVGVSQCLPVVVSLLLAPAGSITLLEQPELHLHPAVQSKLADFLLAMSVSGRQCLVETHSEYLVNRLRLRVAQAEDSNIKGQVAIYFADVSEGSTIYTEVALNKFGAIENWPRGFFDQTESDTEALLHAGMAKRRRDRAHASDA
jgi:predicted ATPase